MLIDFRSASDEHPHSAETLIVGSGAVGLTVAVELARAGRQVIMLEAGGRGVDVESQRYFTSARWRDQRLPGLHLGRFRMLGGTTNFWGGQLVEFDPIVFEHRPWVSDIAWPLTRQELDPYYERGYELLGMGHHLFR
jgi:choline dehydrogenase-like flavoprotein